MSAEIFSVVSSRNKYKADVQMFHATLTPIQSMLVNASFDFVEHYAFPTKHF